MAAISLQGSPAHTIGNLPENNSLAPKFSLTKTDLTEVTLKELAGQRIVLNIFPSVDTPVCATSVRKFNSAAADLNNVTVLCVSMDLPFALKRYCAAEGLDKVMPVSAFRHAEFAIDYGVKIIDGKLQGLLARAIIIIDERGQVIYTEQVNEIADEPNYDAALAVL
jgi:thiol peroxidase